MRTAIIIPCLFLLVTITRAADQNEFPLDPVAYVGGQELAGKDDFTIDRGGFRYKFVDANNKSTFEKDPERNEIQLGGACARMGQ
jgi:hypothetical protein